MMSEEEVEMAVQSEFSVAAKTVQLGLMLRNFVAITTLFTYLIRL